jgi:hypothetical protein
MSATTYIENKKFIGVKLIHAEPMGLLQAQEVLGRSVGYEGWVDEDGDCPGYLVEYEQRNNAPVYRAWSPADVFQDAYRPIDQMTFGLAIEALKKGKKVARDGWNGKGMFLFLVNSRTFKVNCPPLNETDSELTEVSYCSHIDMKTADDKIVPWLASQTDVLAEDWQIVE